MAGPTGMDYAGVYALMQIRGCAGDADLFEAFQVCERAALQAFSDRRDEEALKQLR